MSDRLFTLAQEIEAIRQCSQQKLSEATAFDAMSQNNRLLALEQSLTVMQPHSQANAYGYGDMIDGRRHRATNRMGVTADDMFDSYGEPGYRMPDNRRRGRSSAPDYGWESEDRMPDNRRRRIDASEGERAELIRPSRGDRRMGASDTRWDSDEIIQEGRHINRRIGRNDEAELIRPMRGDRRIGELEGGRMQNFRNDEAEFIRPMRGDRRRGNNRSIGAIEI